MRVSVLLPLRLELRGLRRVDGQGQAGCVDQQLLGGLVVVADVRASGQIRHCRCDALQSRLVDAADGADGPAVEQRVHGAQRALIDPEHHIAIPFDDELLEPLVLSWGDAGFASPRFSLLFNPPSWASLDPRSLRFISPALRILTGAMMVRGPLLLATVALATALRAAPRPLVQPLPPKGFQWASVSVDEVSGIVVPVAPALRLKTSPVPDFEAGPAPGAASVQAEPTDDRRQLDLAGTSVAVASVASLSEEAVLLEAVSTENLLVEPVAPIFTMQTVAASVVGAIGLSVVAGLPRALALAVATTACWVSATRIVRGKTSISYSMPY